MRFIKALIFGLSLAAATGAGIAGEDSTHRYGCTGANFWDGDLATFHRSFSDCGAGIDLRH